MAGTDAVIAWTELDGGAQIGSFILNPTGITSNAVSDDKSDGYFDMSVTSAEYNAATSVLIAKFERPLVVNEGKTFVADQVLNINIAWLEGSALDSSDNFARHNSVGPHLLDLSGCSNATVSKPTDPDRWDHLLYWILAWMALGFTIVGLTYLAGFNDIIAFAAKKVRGTTLLPPDLKLVKVDHKTHANIEMATLSMWTAFKDLGIGEVVSISVVIIGACMFRADVKDFYDGISAATAYSWGWLNMLILGMIVVPVTRNSALLYIFGVPFERALRYHRVLGRLFFLGQLVHLLEVVDNFKVDGVSGWEAFSGNGMCDGCDKTGSALGYDGSYLDEDNHIRGKYGFAAFVCTAMIGLTAVEPIRRKFFEVFYFCHILLVPLIFIFVCLHVSRANVFFLILTPLSLYIIDFGIRVSFVLYYRCSSQTAKVQVLGTGKNTKATHIVLELPMHFGFEAGQYCWINIPEVSLFEWHPFSISCPPPLKGGKAKVSFHCGDIHSKGSFTNRLRMLATDKNTLNVNVDGPHGHVALPLSTYESILLVAGGMGITPMLSIFADLAQRKKAGLLPNLNTCKFVFSARSEEQLGWFKEEFDIARTASGFVVELYHTRAKGKTPYIAGRPKLEALITAAQDSGAATTRVNTFSTSVELKTKAPSHRLSTTAMPKSDPTPDLVVPDVTELEKNSKRVPSGQGNVEAKQVERIEEGNMRSPMTAGKCEASKVAVLACGPPVVCDTCQTVAWSHGFSFHRETFLF